MKKIMLFVSTVLLAVGMNAATVTWTSAGMGDYVGNAYQFFIIGQKGVENIDTVTALLDAGNVSNVKSMAFGSGNIASNGAGTNSSAVESTKPTIGEGTHTSFMVLFDNADVDDATKYVVLSGVGTQTKTVGPSTAKVSFIAGNVSGVVGDAGNWKSTSIPEPTSGILLLIGGALMTLRRKQK